MSDTEATAGRLGPILYFRGHSPGRLRLSVLFVRPDAETPGELTTENATASPERLAGICGSIAWRYRFELPTRADAWYELEGERYAVNAACEGDLSIAYVSCDGMEEGDLDRPPEQRNCMWRRLADRHAAAPLNLLLHGGDQIYADEAVNAHPASKGWPDDIERGLSDACTAELREALRAAFFKRYLFEFSQTEIAWLAARVPSLAMWDDHDICNGWGSLDEAALDSAVGRTLFTAAREFFLLFQQCTPPGELPEACLDQTGDSLTWAVTLPGLHVVAPDLRSERRPRRVIGARGWEALQAALSPIKDGKVLLLSSVPALGPRLSILERLMMVTPGAQAYESDLKDQWQSRRHRQEWRRFLRELVGVHERPGVTVTVLSGEIHLATRATMQTSNGELHQLIASGITNTPPPKLYARTLGALAQLGEAPLKSNPIAMHPLPGRPHVYTTDRNFLVLDRTDGRWSAVWELEGAGATPALEI